jgi:hypothetical protein
MRVWETQGPLSMHAARRPSHSPPLDTEPNQLRSARGPARLLLQRLHDVPVETQFLSMVGRGSLPGAHVGAVIDEGLHGWGGMWAGRTIAAPRRLLGPVGPWSNGAPPALVLAWYP